MTGKRRNPRAALHSTLQLGASKFWGWLRSSNLSEVTASEVQREDWIQAALAQGFSRFARFYFELMERVGLVVAAMVVYRITKWPIAGALAYGGFVLLVAWVSATAGWLVRSKLRPLVGARIGNLAGGVVFTATAISILLIYLASSQATERQLGDVLREAGEQMAPRSNGARGA